MPDLRVATLAQDFDALLAHLAANAASFGGDRDRIAVYAGSGNVYRGLPLFMDPRRTALKAAVLYYGSAEVKTFRGDLPTLFVRAGLDRPPVTRAMTELITLAQTQNVPVTVVNYPGGHHAFEMVDDEAMTRDVIETTLDFVARGTSPAYQASLRRGIPEATAAAHVAAGAFAAAADVYARLVAASPDDARLRLSYGEALLGGSQFAAACAEFERLKGKGLGPRDLGLPAARACLQKGDAEAAIAWLASIPARFLPGAVRERPRFRPDSGTRRLQGAVRRRTLGREAVVPAVEPAQLRQVGVDRGEVVLGAGDRVVLELLRQLSARRRPDRPSCRPSWPRRPRPRLPS